MSQSRRRFIGLGAVTLPALLCAAVATNAQASERVSHPFGTLEGGRTDDLTLDQRRALCPLCKPGSPCAEHLV